MIKGILVSCLLSFSSIMGIWASDHAAPPQGDAHSAEAPKPKKQSLKPFSKEGLDQCQRPILPTPEELGCGTKQYDEYVSKVDAYNNCIKPVENVQMMSLEPCKEIRRKRRAVSSTHGRKRGKGRRHILDSPPR